MGGTSVAGLVALTFNWRIGAEILAGVVAATALGVLVFLVFYQGPLAAEGTRTASTQSEEFPGVVEELSAAD